MTGSPARVTAARARELANAAAAAHGVRGVAREVLMILARRDRGAPVVCSYGWLAREVAAHRVTVIHALARLQSAGLVELVEQGGPKAGRNGYRVNWSAVGLESPAGNTTVHPGDTEASRPAGGSETQPPRRRRGSSETQPPLVAKRNQPGSETQPPNARARSLNQEEPSKGPPPTATERSLQAVPPAMPGRVPPDNEARTVKCEHGRTEAQGGCRLCGTTARDRARAAKEREARARSERMRAASIAAAEAPREPGYVPSSDQIAAIRAGIAGRKAAP